MCIAYNDFGFDCSEIWREKLSVSTCAGANSLLIWLLPPDRCMVAMTNDVHHNNIEEANPYTKKKSRRHSAVDLIKELFILVT